MNDAITQVPRLVRFSVVLALGVAAPVAALRAAPDLPAAPEAATVGAGTDDLRIDLPGLSSGAATAAAPVASVQGIVADVLGVRAQHLTGAALVDVAARQIQPATTPPSVFRTATTTEHTTATSGMSGGQTTTGGRHRPPEPSDTTESAPTGSPTGSTTGSTTTSGKHAKDDAKDDATDDTPDFAATTSRSTAHDDASASSTGTHAGSETDD